MPRLTARASGSESFFASSRASRRRSARGLGGSEDGGIELFRESRPAWRSSSSICDEAPRPRRLLRDLAAQLLKARRQPEQRLHHRLPPGLIDRLGLLARHARKIPFTQKESCSHPRHPVNGYFKVAELSENHGSIHVPAGELILNISLDVAPVSRQDVALHR